MNRIADMLDRGMVMLVISCAGLVACSERLDSVFWMLGCIPYCIGLYRDVQSTIAFGRNNVMRHEISPSFRHFSRYGFFRAIVVQVSIECTLICMIPVLMTGWFDPSVSGGILCAFGLIHIVGYRNNRRLLTKAGIS